jgi:hypothetical protein
VAATLDEFNGTDTSCVETEMMEADEWLETYGICTNVRGNSEAWRDGETLYETLNDYVNGRLCAPKCEETEDDEEGDEKARPGRRVQRS